MSFSLYIFDLDGTLVDSFQDIADAVRLVLADLDLPLLPHQEIQKHIGQGARWLLARCLAQTGDDSVETLARARQLFLDHYTAGLTHHTRPFPGVLSTLQALQMQDAKLALCTNKPYGLTVPLLEQLQLTDYFEIVLGGDSLPTKKPDPTPLLHIMKQLNTSPEKALMVGDSRFDIEAGHRAGVHTCGVTYGHLNRTGLQDIGADYIIDAFPALLSLPTSIGSSP